MGFKTACIVNLIFMQTIKKTIANKRDSEGILCGDGQKLISEHKSK